MPQISISSSTNNNHKSQQPPTTQMLGGDTSSKKTTYRLSHEDKAISNQQQAGPAHPSSDQLIKSIEDNPESASFSEANDKLEDVNFPESKSPRRKFTFTKIPVEIELKEEDSLTNLDNPVT